MFNEPDKYMVESLAQFESGEYKPYDFFDNWDYYSDNYDSLVDMLVHEMVVEETKLDDEHLLKLSMMLDIPFNKLKDVLPIAEKKLHDELEDTIAIQEEF